MALGFRLYQLFRTFWVQNTLACLLGGLICFGLLCIFQTSTLFMQALQETQDAFYVQILPDSPSTAIKPESDIGTAPSVHALKIMYRLQKEFPNFQFERVIDPTLSQTLIAKADITSHVSDALKLQIPNTYIKLKFPLAHFAKVQSAIRKINQMPGIHSIQSDMNILETVQMGLHLIPLAATIGILFWVAFLFYVLQFVISQMIVMRREEIQLEYLLGATKGYQQLPYLFFILLFVIFSMGFAFMLWVFWVVPYVPQVMDWVRGLGFGHNLDFQIHDPKTLFLFVLGFLGLVIVLFQFSWIYHFKRTILDVR